MNPTLNIIDAILESLRRGLITLAGITTALCTSFKVELLKATHDFTVASDAYKLALFKANALLTGTYGAATTNYSDMTGNSDELANGSGYTTGGKALTNTTPLSTGTTAYTTYNGSAVWTASTFTTRGCLNYNTSKSNKAIFVYDFGADEPVVSGTFTVSMPVNDATTGLIRLA